MMWHIDQLKHNVKYSTLEKNRRSDDHRGSEKQSKESNSGENYHNLERNYNDKDDDDDNDNNRVKDDDPNDDYIDVEYERSDHINRTHNDNVNDKNVEVMNNTNQLSKIQSRINENNKSPEHFCETYMTTLQELKSTYPTLIFQVINDNAISINIQGYWFDILVKDNCEDQYDNQHNDVRVDRNAMKFVDNYVIFKDTEALLLEKDETWRGAYLVVNNADDKYLHETEGSALRGKEGKHSFVGRIGYNEKTAEVLALGQQEKRELR
jgi:hypothetical protein